MRQQKRRKRRKKERGERSHVYLHDGIFSIMRDMQRRGRRSSPPLPYACARAWGEEEGDGRRCEGEESFSPFMRGRDRERERWMKM